MTINMDGTAIMQVVATVFIAGCAGYTVTPAQLVVVALLALLASVGTPAAPAQEPSSSSPSCPARAS